IKLGSEDTFIEIWRNRDSHLKEMKGFSRFYFLKGKTYEDYTLFSSYAEWESKQDFENWVNSAHFKHTHRNTDSRPNNPDSSEDDCSGLATESELFSCDPVLELLAEKPVPLAISCKIIF
ncbi:putative enzyme involved in biosynthesis of extracellular polysaccharide, partial [Gilliamella apis SCGC AB-598-P17]